MGTRRLAAHPDCARPAPGFGVPAGCPGDCSWGLAHHLGRQAVVRPSRTHVPGLTSAPMPSAANSSACTSAAGAAIDAASIDTAPAVWSPWGVPGADRPREGGRPAAHPGEDHKTTRVRVVDPLARERVTRPSPVHPRVRAGSGLPPPEPLGGSRRAEALVCGRAPAVPRPGLRRGNGHRPAPVCAAPRQTHAAQTSSRDVAAASRRRARSTCSRCPPGPGRSAGSAPCGRRGCVATSPTDPPRSMGSGEARARSATRRPSGVASSPFRRGVST